MLHMSMERIKNVRGYLGNRAFRTSYHRVKINVSKKSCVVIKCFHVCMCARGGGIR